MNCVSLCKLCLITDVSCSNKENSPGLSNLELPCFWVLFLIICEESISILSHQSSCLDIFTGCCRITTFQVQFLLLLGCWRSYKDLISPTICSVEKYRVLSVPWRNWIICNLLILYFAICSFQLFLHVQIAKILSIRMMKNGMVWP